MCSLRGLGVAIWTVTRRKSPRCLLSSWSVCGIWLSSSHKPLSSTKRFSFRSTSMFIHVSSGTSLGTVRRKERNSSKWVINGPFPPALPKSAHPTSWLQNEMPRQFQIGLNFTSEFIVCSFEVKVPTNIFSGNSKNTFWNIFWSIIVSKRVHVGYVTSSVNLTAYMCNLS